MVVNHLPFLKSSAVSSPDAAALLTFHPVSTHDSPRDLNFISGCGSDLSIWTGPACELFRTSTDILAHPPKAHLPGTFNLGAKLDPSDPSRDPHILNGERRDPDRFLAPPDAAVLPHLVQRGHVVSGRECDMNLTELSDVGRFGTTGVGAFAGMDQLHTFVDRCTGFLSDPACSQGAASRGMPCLRVGGATCCAPIWLHGSNADARTSPVSLVLISVRVRFQSTAVGACISMPGSATTTWCERFAKPSCSIALRFPLRNFLPSTRNAERQANTPCNENETQQA